MEIRKADIKDIDIIMDLYAHASQFMQDTGNKNQWINGYPSKELIISDIESQNSYVCIDSNDEICGVFFFRVGEDVTYLKIYDGQWLNDAPYGVMHRLAGTAKGQGVASFCLQWGFDQCGNMRVDTHHDNVVMQHILIKNGYVKCGIIYIANGTERIAFQKLST